MGNKAKIYSLVRDLKKVELKEIRKKLYEDYTLNDQECIKLAQQYDKLKKELE